MHVNRIRHSVVAMVLSLSLVGTAFADLDQQLNSVFSTLSNTTPPSIAIGDTRRGVISGGSFIVRNRISTPRLVTYVPPSFEAGCGGLDFFGGSFSFINKDQFTALLRNIASAAVSYAFELAIEAMSEQVANAMRRFQKVMQAMNQHMGNSCQMAQGIVNDTLTAFDAKEEFKAATDASFTGLMDDWFSGITKASGNDPRSENEATGRYDSDCGSNANVVWCALKRNNVHDNFFADGDDDLLEAMMTLTGSVVLKPREAHPEGGDVTPVDPVPGYPAMVETVLYGGSGQFYDCADGNEAKECRDVVLVDKVIEKGFVKQIDDMLVGTDGVIPRLRDPFGDPLSNPQLYFLTNAPGGFGGMVRNITIKNPTMAESFARRAAPIIATLMVEQVLQEMEQNARAAVASTDSSYKAKLNDIMSESRNGRQSLMDLLVAHHGNIMELYDHYETLMRLAPRNRYGNSVARAVNQQPTTSR